jgi:Uma2 family endonuclease
MSGGTPLHYRIAFNVVSALDRALSGTPCRVYGSDVRVRVSATGLYTYPDVSVFCNSVDERSEVLEDPSFIAEVLSPTTEAYDRGRKFQHYQTIESLKQYMIVSQDRVYVELFTRREAGKWERSAFASHDDSIGLESLGCPITVGQIYAKVDVPLGPLGPQV